MISKQKVEGRKQKNTVRPNTKGFTFSRRNSLLKQEKTNPVLPITKRIHVFATRKGRHPVKIAFASAKANRAFTLLEVLVSVAIIGILVTVASAVFINTIRSANKANVTAEARENGSNVIETFDKDIRQASAIAPDNGSGLSSLTVTTAAGTIIWTCIAPSGSVPGAIYRQIGLAGASLPITNKNPQNGISIDPCSFDVSFLGNSHLVKIRFVASQPSGISSTDFSVNLPFDHSVATRSF